MPERQIKIELLLRLISNSIDASGNGVKIYDVYSIDESAKLGKTTVTKVSSTTPSTAALAGSGGNLSKSNSDASDFFSHYHTHTVFEYGSYIYQFDADSIGAPNVFLLKNVESGVSRVSPAPAVRSISRVSPANLSSTNEGATELAWSQKSKSFNGSKDIFVTYIGREGGGP